MSPNVMSNKGPGRPKLPESERLETVGFRLPASRVKKLRNLAAQRKTTLSKVLVELVSC